MSSSLTSLIADAGNLITYIRHNKLAIVKQIMTDTPILLDMKICRYKLENGEFTPLTYALLSEDADGVLHYILSLGPDLTLEPYVYTAILKGKYDLALLLLAAGAPANRRGDQSSTHGELPFQLAIQKGAPLEFITQLLQYQVTVEDKSGALHMAIDAKNLPLMDVLVRNGADPSHLCDKMSCYDRIVKVCSTRAELQEMDEILARSSH